MPQSDKKRGNKKWPIFVLGAAFRRSVDKHAEECNVLDVCVHPTVITDCVNDKSGDTREEVSDGACMPAYISRRQWYESWIS